MADEYIDILNDDGSDTGKKALKSEAHKKGLYHRSAHLWLYTSTGKVLVQQRAMNKDTFPALWDISVAGHIAAGESASSAILREAKEEIGISLSETDLQFLKVRLSKKRPNPDIIDNEYQYLFLARINEGTKFVLQSEEVIQTKYLYLEDLKKLVVSNNSKDFVPHGNKYYSYILQNITTNLKSS